MEYVEENRGRCITPPPRRRFPGSSTWSGQQLGSLGRLFCYRSTRPMIAPPDPTLGALCSLASALAWAVVSLLVRRLAGTLNSPTINALRTLGAGALLMTWVLVTEGVEGLLGIGLATFILLAVSIVLSGSLGDTIFFESARFLGLARAMTASMTYPMISAVLAAAFLAEPITPALVMGSLLTLGGLALIVGARPSEPDRPGHLWLGLLASQGASIAWALGVIMLKVPLATMDSTTAQAVRLPLAALVLFATPWVWGSMGTVREGGPALGGLLVLLAVLTAGSSLLFVVGVKHAGVGVSTVLSSTAPMFAIPFGTLFLGERITTSAALGALITVAGVAVLNL
jgi:drug/metabolite transporter (DMT)-like permease